MDDMNSVSLTQGCFVHKPEKLKKKKTDKHSGSYRKTDVNQVLWNEIAAKIQLIEKRFYAETFLDGIVEFINSNYQFPLQDMHEVPAAVLVMGVNMPDHCHIFNLLEKNLHQNSIPNTLILQSNKCLNVSSMCQVILHELLQKFKMSSNMDIEPPKKAECSFSKLYEYYKSIFVEENVSKKTNRSMQTHTSSSKTIVILVQDVESFNPEVLQELILLCKIYSSKLPIVLIFGMASAMVTLHSILPQKALCCLGVETFYSVSPSQYLTEIIEEVIVSPEMPFKFGPRVFRLVVDTVLYHDFSVSNLTYMLKFTMIEHFYNKNFTSLCCYESDIVNRVHSLETKALEELKELPSLKMYLDNNPRFISCMKDPTVFKESVISFMQKLFRHQATTLALLRLLHCLVKDLPGFPFGKHLRELYSISLEKEIHLTDAFSEAMKLLNLQSQSSLQSKLESCNVVLQEIVVESSSLKQAKETVKSSLGKLSKLTTSDFEKNTQSPMSLDNEKVTSRFQLQEKIQLSLKMKRSNFEATRNEIVEDFAELFKCIIPPSHLPLFEIFYFDNVHSLKKHIMAVPRVTSCYSLTNPHHYLKCSCCKVPEGDVILSTMPDISILYKLHLECGKLINLYDWLESFKAIKSNETTKRTKSKNKTNDEELNIRFLLAVSELQMLGFIKPTKRKTDHVARVTFGTF